MAVCGFVSGSDLSFNTDFTAAQCIQNGGYWVSSAQDINETLGPYAWAQGGELFAFAFSAVVSIWLVGLVGGLIVGAIRRG